MGRDVAQRVFDIEEVLGGAGNDIIDMSSPDLALQNFIGLMIDGGVGNDVIWSSVSNDIIKGGDGNDKIFGGKGNDVISV